MCCCNFAFSLYNCHLSFIVLFYFVSLSKMHMFTVLGFTGMYTVSGLCPLPLMCKYKMNKYEVQSWPMNASCNWVEFLQQESSDQISSVQWTRLQIMFISERDVRRCPIMSARSPVDREWHWRYLFISEQHCAERASRIHTGCVKKVSCCF